MSEREVAAELAAWGIDVATITGLAVDGNSALIRYSKDGKPWGLVIEEDHEAVARIASYLKAQGLPIDRDSVLG